MVWGRMGLLDDAIREHLELKRLKGADAGDVAREEREALGEGGPGEQAGASVYEEDYNQVQAESVRPGHGEDDRPAEQVAPSDHVAAGQETIELDMESVLASSPHGPAKAPDLADAATVGTPGRDSDPGDSLEWETPTEQDISDSGEDVETRPEGEPVEDVLEETPDFLRDTPEQDRLWFEQRPPRDFDFNE